jgi:hypothetical protein
MRGFGASLEALGPILWAELGNLHWGNKETTQSAYGQFPLGKVPRCRMGTLVRSSMRSANSSAVPASSTLDELQEAAEDAHEQIKADMSQPPHTLLRNDKIAYMAVDVSPYQL